MLTIGKLGVGQERYYLEKVAQGAEDYYSGEGESPGQWTGDAATELGLEGDVPADGLTAMLTGQDPATGEQLVGNFGVSRDSGPVPGFDLTFSAPKSVSLLWALGDEPTSATVRQAHQRSVDAALGYVKRHATWARRGSGGARFVHGKGLIAAAFRHRSSRAGDPQLHTHVLIANATQGPDGRWSRLFHPAIYEHAKTAGYLYEAQLRTELTRTLGVRWQPVRNGIAEIQGFTDEQLRHFSTRRAEILEATGTDASAKSRQTAALETRRAKDHDVDPVDLREHWGRAALRVGLDGERIQAIARPAPARSPSNDHPSPAETDRALTERASHFDRRDAVQAIAAAHRSGEDATEVERLSDSYLDLPSVVKIAAPARGAVYTTERILKLERSSLELTEQLRTARRCQVPDPIAARILADHPTLNVGQREMVNRLLSDGNGVAVIVGEPGTGKTFALTAAAEGWTQAGHQIRAATPTRAAAAVLTGAGLPATSVTALLGELDRTEASGTLGLPRNSVLIIDEAGMVGSASIARVLHHVDAAQGKLVLVGDPEQLPELSAGGLFRALSEREDTIHLYEVMRQRHDLDRDNIKRIRHGRGAEAFELYRSAEQVIVTPDTASRREAMVADWWRSHSAGDDALMIARRNVDVDELNRLARELLRDHGALGPEQVTVAGVPFSAGDLAITRLRCNQPRINPRERWRILNVDPDRHQITLQALIDERTVTLDRTYLDTLTQHGQPALQHGYAGTVYVAQGQTVDRAFVAAETAMSRQELNVAMSRSREQSYLYAVAQVGCEREEYAPREQRTRDPLEQLVSAMERNGTQLAATDEALRAELAELSTPSLASRRRELLSVLRRDELAERRATRAAEHLAQTEASAAIQSQRARTVEGDPTSTPADLALLHARERAAQQQLDQRHTELGPDSGPKRDLSPVRTEFALVERELAERRRIAITASRIAPPLYIRGTVGERPADSSKAATWERAVHLIESYRQQNSVGDPARALGARPEHPARRVEWLRANRRLEASTRQLHLESPPVAREPAIELTR